MPGSPPDATRSRIGHAHASPATPGPPAVTEPPRQNRDPSRIDLDEVSRLVEALEQDLALARTDSTRIEALRAEVEQLRAMLGNEQAPGDDLERGLSGLRDAMHKLGDELISDAFEGSRHIAQIGRLLGM
jgi:hypothetical protein